MKKAIALAVAMTAAAGANAAFETNVGFGENVLGSLIFTAWTTTDGLDNSVNIDLGLNGVNDAGDDIRDFSAENRSWTINLSPLGSDLSTLQWTVFANNFSGAGPADGSDYYEVFTTANNTPVLPQAAFNSQYTAFIGFQNANAEVGTNPVVGVEGQATFGANVLFPTFGSVGVTGQLGDTLSFVGYNHDDGVATILNSLSFDGTTLTLAPASSEVPVPAAAWLFGSALVGLAGIARKRKA